MDLFVNQLVFNPDLIGKMVQIHGLDRNGRNHDNVYQVMEALWGLLLVQSGPNPNCFRTEEFDGTCGNLKLTVLMEVESGA